MQRTLGLRKEECDHDEVDGIETNEDEVISPRDVGDGDGGNL